MASEAACRVCVYGRSGKQGGDRFRQPLALEQCLLHLLVEIAGRPQEERFGRIVAWYGISPGVNAGLEPEGTKHAEVGHEYARATSHRAGGVHIWRLQRQGQRIRDQVGTPQRQFEST